MSTIIKDRDEVASVRSARSQPRQIIVRRYRYPNSAADDNYESSDTKVIREREVEPEPRDRVEYRYTERERERESDTISQLGSDREREREVRSVYRHIERRERETNQSPSPENREIRETRILRERDVEPEEVSDRLTADSKGPYQLEKYSKSTEYFSRPEAQLQPIVLEAPKPIFIPAPQQQIIVRPPEPSYEVNERTEAVEDRQVARPRPEEDYYYERRTREVDRPRRYQRDHEDEYDRRHSQHDDRNYYSDDDVYIRREREEDGFVDRDRSPHRRRHLAEGVLAGVAGAEIIRHHRKAQGEDPGSHIPQLMGYGALGGIGAEAYSRWRNRSKSRERNGRGRHRSRSPSISKGKAIAGVAALAGLGALAYAAGKNSGRQNTTIIEQAPRRNGSHNRRHTISDEEDIIEEERLQQEQRHINPGHSKTRIAQAGLLGAAVAGMVNRVRSHSRGGRSRSKGRIPLVAAGLGSAAVAGMYERVKARNEKRARSRSVGRSGSRGRSRSGSRSRSRSRSVSVSGSRRTPDETALVEYGDDPIYSSSALERRRSWSRSTGRHSDQSPGRRHRRSSGSRSRSRSQNRLAGAAGAAAAVGAAGLAAHEITKRRERRREREREAEQRRK